MLSRLPWRTRNGEWGTRPNRIANRGLRRVVVDALLAALIPAGVEVVLGIVGIRLVTGADSDLDLELPSHGARKDGRRQLSFRRQ